MISLIKHLYIISSFGFCLILLKTAIMQKHHRLLLLMLLYFQQQNGGIMGTIRNVSKSEPCPICGKTDWCTILKPDQESYPGQELYICRRIQQDTVSNNGFAYSFIKELSDGSSLYTIKTEKAKRYRNHSRHNERKHIKEEDLYPETLKNESLDRIYHSFLHLLPLSAKHYRKLKSDGWSDSLIKRSLIRSINFKRSYDESKKYYTDSFERFRITSTLVNEYGPLDGVPGFYLNDANKWTFVGRQGMLIPIYDLHGNLYRLRLRLDKPEVDENGKEKNKYKNFSSFHSEDDGFGVLKNTYNHGCRAGSCIGLYYNPNLDSSDMCYITEGEKKAILTNDYLRYPVISLPGTGTYNKLYDLYDGINAINFLKSIGCDTTVVAYDADKIYNQQVLRYEQKLVQLLLGEGFSVYIASWNAGFGKGIDDILPLGILPTLKPV